jgi:endo-1,4-beta-xylanase
MRKLEFLSKLTLLSLVCVLFSACQNEEDGLANLSCENLYLKNASKFPIGLSFSNRQRNTTSDQIILNEANQITSTEFFASKIWKNPQEFDFTNLDQAVDFAMRSGKAIHAHCLMYPLESVNPQWLQDFSGSNEEFETHVRNFITATVSRYKGKVRSYDITNELFQFNSSKVEQSWMRKRFNSDQEFFDFIGRCFKYAHAADPKALLFYNDYGQEFTNNNHEKGRAIVDLLEYWKKTGVPVHGYGLQVHTNIYRKIEDIENALALASSTGLQVHISELDISVNWADFDNTPLNGGIQGLSYVDEDLKMRQKDMYRQVAAAYGRVVPKKQQFGITLWDLTDKYSWLKDQRFEAGTMFDENYQRKPAFYGFMEGLSGKSFDCN